MLTKLKLEPKISAKSLDFFCSYTAYLTKLNLELNQVDLLLNKFAMTQITALPSVNSQLQIFLSCYSNLKRVKKTLKHNILAHQHRYSQKSSLLKIKTTFFPKNINEGMLAVFFAELNDVFEFLQVKIQLSKTKKDIFYYTNFLNDIPPVINIIKNFNLNN